MWTTMKVLVPYDGSDTSLAALNHALKQFPDADIIVLHVIDQDHIGTSYGELLVGREKLRERAEEGATDLLAEAESVADEVGVDIDTVVQVGHPVRDILEYVEANQVNQVVIGGKGLSNVPQLLSGSVSFDVLLHVDVPVTVVR